MRKLEPYLCYNFRIWNLKVQYLPEQKEELPIVDKVIVAPGFESNTHRSGLFWDTRLRLLAAAMYYENGKTQKIIVGGAQIREMKDSFANLMKKELIEKYGIPETDIETEEFTFDTPSQVKWSRENAPALVNSAFITDSEQKLDIEQLLKGNNLQLPVMSSEDIILKLARKSKHFKGFFKRLHSSPYWLKWKGRERLLTQFTKHFDSQGERRSMHTKKRVVKTF